jgi:hypothetical protein
MHERLEKTAGVATFSRGRQGWDRSPRSPLDEFEHPSDLSARFDLVVGGLIDADLQGVETLQAPLRLGQSLEISAQHRVNNDRRHRPERPGRNAIRIIDKFTEHTSQRHVRWELVIDPEDCDVPHGNPFLSTIGQTTDRSAPL